MLACEHIKVTPTPIEMFQTSQLDQNRKMLTIPFLMFIAEDVQDATIWPSYWDYVQSALDIVFLIVLIRLRMKNIDL